MTALYRFDTVRQSLGVDEWDEPLPGRRLEVKCTEYPIVKRTPKGAWIDCYGTQRFVLLTARKQFACETREAAAESFRRRKQCQIKLLSERINDAKEALKLIDRGVPA